MSQHSKSFLVGSVFGVRNTHGLKGKYHCYYIVPILTIFLLAYIAYVFSINLELLLWNVINWNYRRIYYFFIITTIYLNCSRGWFVDLGKFTKLNEICWTILIAQVPTAAVLIFHQTVTVIANRKDHRLQVNVSFNNKVVWFIQILIALFTVIVKF